MLNFFNYSLSIELNPFLLVLFIILAVLFVIYIYKYTIPKTSLFVKIILISIRSLVFALLLFLIFEPSITKKEVEESKPIVPIFIDNSSSIVNNDSLFHKKIQNLIDEIPGSESINYEFYSFGSEVKHLSKDSLSMLMNNETLTNFQDVFNKLVSDDRYVTSAVIISDGIINDGSSSIYEAEELNFPVYTIGTGDTTRTNDVFINNILNNRFIYKETPTVIAAEVSNQNLTNEEAIVSFKENNKLIDSKKIILSESGINKVVFDYIPKEAGKQKLSVEVSRIKEESNYDNNLRSTFIDVLENKLNILVIAGAPSADFSAIFQSLHSVDEYNPNKYLQISNTVFMGDNFENKLDSAQIVVLINFPFENTPNELIQKVKTKIEEKDLPYFNLIGADFSSLKLNTISEMLPFTETRSFDEIYSAQPNFINPNSSLLKSESSGNLQTNNLPPIVYPNGGFKVKAGSEVIAKARVNNISTELPMLITSSIAGRRSITLIGSNIWRWRIDSEDNKENFFDQLLYNSIQWLRVSDRQRKFFVETSKSIYSPAEEIEFISELYDDKLEPLNTGEIAISIEGSGENYSLKLNNDGNGIYTGSINIPRQGDFNYTASAEIDGINIAEYNGKFNIGEVDLEKLQTVMNENYLKMIASLTGGNYSYINKSDEIFRKIESSNSNKVKHTISSVTYDPLSLESVLIILILLLALEWFIRKREGML